MNTRWRVAQALEIRWWQRYLAGRDPGDYLLKKRRYWRRILQEADVSVAPGERVLDAGCGPAGIFLILEGRQVTAVDPLLEAYESKLPHFSRRRYPAVNFQCLPLENLKVTTLFDKVCCFNAINHVADLSLSFDRLVAALRPGGILLLTVDVHRRRFLKHLFRLVSGDLLHPHQHALADYVAMVEARGCSVLHTKLLKPGIIFDYCLIVAHKGI
jgi:SAM-dependent methyltransferase